MSFFKNLKNMLTGGSAQVSVRVETPALEAPFKVQVAAQIGDTDCKVRRVYLRLRGIEAVRVPDVEVARRNGEQVAIIRETVETSTTTCDLTIDLAMATTLKANEHYEWETEVQMPAGSLPTYGGRLALHTWQILAGLDMAGNDPDSGWLTLELY